MFFWKSQFLVLILIFSFFSESKSQNKIELKDSTLLVGENYLLPVYANLQVQKGDTVRVILRAVSGLRFGYNSIPKGNINSLMDSLSPIILDIHLFNENGKHDSSQVDVTFIVANQNASKLFDLDLFTHAGKDSTDTITPVELYINGKSTKFISKKGIYKFDSYIYQRNDDRLEYSYPNPFTEHSIINFTLANDSEIKFKLFSEHGRLIDLLPNTRNEIEYYLREAGADSNYTNKPFIEGNETYKLKKGTYELTLWSTYKLSAGAYVLVMENGDKATTIKILHEK
jgi:hypothetical protein